MKKICKIILTCIMFFIIVTESYGAGEILPENRFGIKKTAILVAGIFLVVQILFIGYKLDKNEESKKNDLKKEENDIEEKELFDSLNKTVEDLPNIMSPKKKNIKLKELPKINLIEEKKFDRKNVKIVRERKNRNIQSNLEKEKIKQDLEIKKEEVKTKGKMRKEELKKEINRKNVKNNYRK